MLPSEELEAKSLPLELSSSGEEDSSKSSEKEPLADSGFLSGLRELWLL